MLLVVIILTYDLSGCCKQARAGPGNVTGAAGALPDWGASGEDGVQGAGLAVGADDCGILVGRQNAARACFGDAEGKVLGALCRGQGTKMRVFWAWVEPRNGSPGARKPKAGYSPLTLLDEGVQAQGWTIRAVVGRRLGSVDDDWRWWMQKVGGLCSSPGSSPDCALGLTP